MKKLSKNKIVVFIVMTVALLAIMLAIYFYLLNSQTAAPEYIYDQF